MTSVGTFDTDYGHALFGGCLGRVPLLDNYSGVRVLKESAVAAPKERSGYDAVGVAVSVPWIDLFLEPSPASGALELPVEGLLGFNSWRELVRESLYRLPGKLRVEFFVRGHIGNSMSKKAGSQNASSSKH